MTEYDAEGGQDSVLRCVLRVGLTVGQCPVVVLYLSYTCPILVLHLSYDPNFKIELAKGMAWRGLGVLIGRGCEAYSTKKLF